MASCVLLLLLFLCCYRWCRCLRQLFSFYEQCEKKKLRVHIPRERIFVFFSLQSGFLFVCHQFFYCWGV